MIRIIQKLKDIRTAQDAFKSIHGTYTNSPFGFINQFREIRFIENRTFNRRKIMMINLKKV